MTFKGRGETTTILVDIRYSLRNSTGTPLIHECSFNLPELDHRKKELQVIPSVKESI